MKERRYGCWSGKPEGTSEDKTRCIVSVAERGRSVLFNQCCRKRGYGQDGLFCKQHALMIEKGIPLYIPMEKEV